MALSISLRDQIDAFGDIKSHKKPALTRKWRNREIEWLVEFSYHVISDLLKLFLRMLEISEALFVFFGFNDLSKTSCHRDLGRGIDAVHSGCRNY